MSLLLTDNFGRSITYLRISVTDRCYYRCVYCMPAEGVAWQPHANILTYEEITQIVRLLAEYGVTRIRLTGGEPLVRRDLTTLVQSLAAIPQIEDISLTTNGLLLKKFAAELAAAGLKRVNISLDTLDADKFKQITRGGSFEQTWQGIEAAEAVGLDPIKINVVVVRGLNDDELPDLARLSLTHPWHIRFIELMPVGNAQDWGNGFPQPGHRYISVQDMTERLSFLGYQPFGEPMPGNGPARMFKIPGSAGTIGFISPLGEHFCGSCNRLRLTADGRLRPCLLHDIEIPVREPLRAGEDLLPYIQKAVGMKPEGHELSENHLPQSRKMAQIGG